MNYVLDVLRILELPRVAVGGDIIPLINGLALS